MTAAPTAATGARDDCLNPQDFFASSGGSPISTWWWPDCSRPRLLSLGTLLHSLGYDEGEVRDDIDAYLGLVHPEDRPHLQAIARSVVQRPRAGNYEVQLRLRRKQGGYCGVRILGSIVRQEGAAAPAAYGVARLLHAHEETADSALRLSEDALSTVLNEIGHPVVLMTPDGCMLQHNDAMVHAVGGTVVADSEGYRYCPFLHERDGTPTVADFIDGVILTGRRQQREIWRFDRWWHVYLVPLRNAEGAVRRLLLLAQDISALKAEQEAELTRERALRTTLAREVHHRIKNHLQGLVGLLRVHSRSGRSMREVIDNAVVQIQSIAAVHGLLSRSGETAIDFAELIARIVELTSVGAAIPVDCIIEHSSARKLCISEEESVPLAVVVGELFMNALKHTSARSGSRVVVRFACSDEVAELCVTNRPATLPQGFELPSTATAGTGIDLVMALLPRNRSSLEIAQEGEAVTTRLRISRGNAASEGTIGVQPARAPLGPRAAISSAGASSDSADVRNDSANCPASSGRENR